MELLVLAALVGGFWAWLKLREERSLASRTRRGPEWNDGRADLTQIEGHTPAKEVITFTPTKPTGGEAAAALTSPEISSLTVSTAVSRQESRWDAGRWVPAGESISVQGYTLPGMLYVGRWLTAVRGQGTEPALIDPVLPVSAPEPDAELGYYPTYSSLSPTARGGYLQWLSDRANQRPNIGFAFLFLYGLERRVIYDVAVVTSEERRTIREELKKLLRVYGSHPNFRRYASELIAILEPETDLAQTLQNPPAPGKSYEVSHLQLKLGLGKMALIGHPVPAPWALTWVKSHDQFFDRTPGTRCPDSFEKLFSIRYHETFGAGVLLKINKTLVKGSYRPASPSFSGELSIPIAGLPDVTVLKQPIERLITLANSVLDELDAYSRYLGRNPDAGESPSALALLPGAIFDRRDHPVLDRLSQGLESWSVGDGLILGSYEGLQSIWPSLPSTTVLKRDAVAIAQCLEKLGYGLEPDIRFGVHLLRPSEPLVLFRLSPNAPTSPSTAYASATLAVHLGALLAHADQSVAKDEEKALMAHVADSLELTEAERLRLKAYLKWMLATPPEMTGLKKRLEALSSERRTAIGAFLSRLVCMDGHISPKELQTLQKIYRQLGLDPNTVFADTHAAAREPVIVREADASPGYALPRTPSPSAPGRVDLKRVEAMSMESDRVAVMLREIFTAEEDLPLQPEPLEPCSPSKGNVWNLDSAHSAFVREVIGCDHWTRSELADLAARYSLLADGAIDTVNEAALEQAGEPLLDGDDPVDVNPTVRKEISL